MNRAEAMAGALSGCAGVAGVVRIPNAAHAASLTHSEVVHAQ